MTGIIPVSYTHLILLEGEKVESGLTAKDFEGTYKAVSYTHLGKDSARPKILRLP